VTKIFNGVSKPENQQWLKHGQYWRVSMKYEGNQNNNRENQ